MTDAFGTMSPPKSEGRTGIPWPTRKTVIRRHGEPIGKEEFTMSNAKLLIAAFAALGLSTSAFAKDVFIYPKKGQSAEQQAKDKGECSTWASSQTGYDPAIHGGDVDEAGKGKVAKNTAIGTAGGAAGGAVLGEVIGDRAGYGAAAGAALGGFLGHKKGKKSKEEAQQSAYAHEDDYNRAFATCMDGRGYSVN